jgi:hypothetical protein
MATEAVLFGKLGENEVVESADFGKNQQKKWRRYEHPTRRDYLSVEIFPASGMPKGSFFVALPRDASLRDAKRGEVCAVSTERRIPTGCKRERERAGRRNVFHQKFLNITPRNNLKCAVKSLNLAVSLFFSTFIGFYGLRHILHAAGR